MSDLVIKLSGEIQQSNFDEWKSNQIGQLGACAVEACVARA